MEINEATLQNILKAYGKEPKADKIKTKTSKLSDEKPLKEKSPVGKKLVSEDLNIINYDNEGKVKVNSSQKKALIDFFQ